MLEMNKNGREYQKEKYPKVSQEQMEKTKKNTKRKREGNNYKACI